MYCGWILELVPEGQGEAQSSGISKLGGERAQGWCGGGASLGCARLDDLIGPSHL